VSILAAKLVLAAVLSAGGGGHHGWGHGGWGPGWGSPIGFYGSAPVIVQNSVQYAVVNGQLVAVPVGATLSLSPSLVY
jgi:hypothetical protein